MRELLVRAIAASRSNEYSVGALVDDFHGIDLLQCPEPIADTGRRYRTGEAGLPERGRQYNVRGTATIDCGDDILERLAQKLQFSVAP